MPRELFQRGCPLLSAWLCLAGSLAAQETSAIRFEDISAQAQLEFVHRDGSSGAHYLIEVVASGMASFDYDLDGRVDIYFLNGAALKGTHYDTPPQNCLLRNLGEFKFRNVTANSQTGDTGFGLGVTVGDVDNDGFPDVYVTNAGPNVLYHNNGDGTFTPLEQPVLACGDKVGGGCCMLDIEADGDLDIYAASYIRFDYDIEHSKFRGRVVYGGPLLYPKEQDNLLQNDGRGGFVDISSAAGIGELAEWGMGTICVDYDRDGDTDIFVANDSTENFLWTNDGRGQFTNSALLAGVAFDHRGDPQGSMGVDAGDFNQDQVLDLFQTAYTKQLTTLYQNVDGLYFEDATLSTGAGVGTHYPVNWGTGFADFDNDGDPDIFISNGHIHDNMDDLDNTVSYRIRNQVLENQSGTAFKDVSLDHPGGLQALESSRGSILEDLNNDGWPDIVVLNSRTSPTVLRNRSLGDGRWLQLELVGIDGNRDAVGSQVTVRAGGRTLIQEVHSGRGYQSHFGSRLHFGLGPAAVVDQIEIRWHGGPTQVIDRLPAGRTYIVRQGYDPVSGKVSS